MDFGTRWQYIGGLHLGIYIYAFAVEELKTKENFGVSKQKKS